MAAKPTNVRPAFDKVVADIKRVEVKCHNSTMVYFKDGTRTPLSQVDYPLGHRKRRKDGIPLLLEKFERNIAYVFAEKQRRAIREVCRNRRRLAAMPVNEFLDLLV